MQKKKKTQKQQKQRTERGQKLPRGRRVLFLFKPNCNGKLQTKLKQKQKHNPAAGFFFFIPKLHREPNFPTNIEQTGRRPFFSFSNKSRKTTKKQPGGKTPTKNQTPAQTTATKKKHRAAPSVLFCFSAALATKSAQKPHKQKRPPQKRKQKKARKNFKKVPGISGISFLPKNKTYI